MGEHVIGFFSYVFSQLVEQFHRLAEQLFSVAGEIGCHKTVGGSIA